jgi:hypothetical protein
MAAHLKSIDISDAPQLLQLAEEVHRTHESWVLRRDGEDLALVVPLPAPATKRRRSRIKTEADFAAFRSAAGSWSDVDTDRLLADIYADRERSDRPPVDL